MPSPSADALKAALTRFAAAVEAHYGTRLHGLWLYGSRARGDHRPDSDVDIAVVLEGEVIGTKDIIALADIAFDVLLATGHYVEAHPVGLTTWRHPPVRGLIANCQRAAVALPMERDRAVVHAG